MRTTPVTPTIPIITARFEGQDVRLIEAAKHGDVQELRALISQGVNVDAADARGVTALIVASMAGKLQAVQILLAAGADTSAKDQMGYDAYHAAMFCGDFRGVAVEPYGEIMALLKGRTAGGNAPATSCPK